MTVRYTVHIFSVYSRINPYTALTAASVWFCHVARCPETSHFYEVPGTTTVSANHHREHQPIITESNPEAPTRTPFQLPSRSRDHPLQNVCMSRDSSHIAKSWRPWSPHPHFLTLYIKLYTLHPGTVNREGLNCLVWVQFWGILCRGLRHMSCTSLHESANYRLPHCDSTLLRSI